MSVIASTDVYNHSDEVLFDKRTLEKLKNLDIEELDYEQSSEEEDGDHNLIGKGDIVISKQNRRAHKAREA